MRLPSFEYSPAKNGYWLPVTSTLNWCEEDYYATRFVAETVNTLTNLAFICLAIKGMHNCLTNGHDHVFGIAYLGYFMVGIGSLCFHATLKYPMQLVDELSMIYTTALACYASFSYRKSTFSSVCIGAFLILLCVFITAYYHYLQDPTFHQNAYAILTATVLIRSMYVMEMTLRPFFRQQELLRKREHSNEKGGPVPQEEQQRQDRRDEKILKTMWIMIAYGLSVFLGGFAIWTLDNMYCSNLRRWRRAIGLPWGVVLEGHGWWHLMTGVGAYFFIMWAVWLRHCLNGRQDQYEMVWPRLCTSLPIVVRKFPARTSSLMTGVAKKRS